MAVEFKVASQLTFYIGRLSGPTATPASLNVGGGVEEQVMVIQCEKYVGWCSCVGTGQQPTGL